MYKINNTLKLKKDSNFIYIHSLRDKFILKLSKNVTTITHKPMSCDVILLAILKILDPNNALLKVLDKYQTNTTYTIIENDKEVVKCGIF